MKATMRKPQVGSMTGQMYTKRLLKATVTIVTAVSCPRMWREKNVDIFKDSKAKQTGGFGV